MPAVPLPDDPNFEQLRKLAKDLRDDVRAGTPAVAAGDGDVALARRLLAPFTPGE